jgi:hypothetical protein
MFYRISILNPKHYPGYQIKLHCQKASRYQRVSELHKRIYEPEA